MTTIIVALIGCFVGVILGIVYAAWLDMRMHAREAQEAQASKDTAQQYYRDADAQAAAVCKWMGQSYRNSTTKR